MITIRDMNGRPTSPAREALLDERLRRGALRARPRERLRDGRLPADGLSLVAADAAASSAPCGCGTSSAGCDRPALLLGPLAVASGLPQPRHRRRAGAPRASPRRAGSAMADHPRRRCALLQPLRLLGGCEPEVSGCPARSRRTGCSALGTRSPPRFDGVRAAAACGAAGMPAQCPRAQAAARAAISSSFATLASAPSCQTSRTRTFGRLCRMRAWRPLPFSARAARYQRRERLLECSENDQLARARPHRRSHRDDRLRLDRQRHPAADRAALHL